jgi:cation diffusion facilitator CzcD-associated flavoprotein CzcO
VSDGSVDGLDALRRWVQFDLACLNYPPVNWVVPTMHPRGRRVSDVVVIGGGMAGLVLTFSLLRYGIRNIRCLDRSPAGFEGPWVTYARMETLRSPKVLTGPAAGIPSLTFRAWFTAQFGAAEWERLDKIPRAMWMDYLRWYRQVLELPVENGIEVARVRPAEGLLALDLVGGTETCVLTRKVVMATGREGLGRPHLPSFMHDLPHAFWAHTADDIDFPALRGKRVIVIGGSASAMDNAAEALEAGCTELRMLIRRKTMPRINKLTGIGSAGFNNGYRAMSDAWRWRTMHYSHETQAPAPRNSTQRVSRHSNAFFHLGSAIDELRMGDGHVLVRTSRGKSFAADFIILATGFTVETTARPEIAAYADAIATWADRYLPPQELANAELGGFPYLGPNYQFTEKRPGEALFLADIHCFNHAASLSFGKVTGDIPGISTGAAWLATGIAAEFYNRDIEAHWQALLDFDTPELFGDEWTDAELGPG